jgi:hypothetical protein
MLKGNDVIFISADCAESALIIRPNAAVRVSIGLFINEARFSVSTGESKKTEFWQPTLTIAKERRSPEAADQLGIWI